MIKRSSQKVVSTLTPKEAQIKLETLCAKGEHCTFELRQKLWKWKISSLETDKIINNLIKAHFVDDVRYARSYINDKVRFSRWGLRKISVALVAKHIDRDIIHDLLKDVDKQLLEDNLIYILSVKARSISEVNTYDGRTKLFRYGISRGYHPELVSKIIRSHFI